MILTVEIPHEGEPRCWFAFDEADFIRKAQAPPPGGEAVVFRTDTARRLLAEQGPTAGLPELAQAHGWDTPLYRADFLLAPGVWQAEPVPEFVAWVAALAHGLKACRVYRDEQQALDALFEDPLYAGREGFYAHMALRDQLIALEVLADDM